MRLTDTQLGFLTGIAFSLFYATLGIPDRSLGRLRKSRHDHLSDDCVVGAHELAFVAITNFAQLLVVRMCAAVGDVGVRPPAYSLLGDYFPDRAERTRAMYVWSLAGPLAAMISWMVGGWLNEQFGWRWTFFLLGVLGLPLAALAQWTLVEPRVAVSSQFAMQRASAPPLKAVLGLLWHRISCRYLMLALILMTLVGYGVGSWQGAFMMRRHEIGTAELGVWMGLIGGVGGVVSILLGGYIVGRWFADRDRGQMYIAAAALACGAPIYIAFLTLPTKEHSLMMLMVLALVFGAFLVSPYVMLQRLVPDRMRATALMVVLFLANLIGSGLGPLIVGATSDLLEPRFGTVDALRFSMMIVAVGYLGAGYCFFRVVRTLDADLIEAEQSETAEVV